MGTLRYSNNCIDLFYHTFIYSVFFIKVFNYEILLILWFGCGALNGASSGTYRTDIYIIQKMQYLFNTKTLNKFIFFLK